MPWKEDPDDWVHVCKGKVWAMTNKDQCDRCGKERPIEEDVCDVQEKPSGDE